MKAFLENEIIEGIKTGDYKVLNSLRESKFPDVKRFVRQNSGDVNDAEDLFQETIMKIYLNIKEDRYKSEGKFDGYFSQVMRNTWLAKLKVTKRRGETEFKDYDLSDDSDERIEMVQQNESKLNLLEDYFNKMGEQCKEVLESFYFKKISLEEIATSFGWTYGYAKKKNYKCKAKLKKMLLQNPEFSQLLNI